jgi:NADP-dependent 3-hydroxy acid dehydrogenase YdfG
MSKVAVIVGYGPGTSRATAEKFGAEGFSLALIARNQERLAAAVKEFAAKGVKAAGFTADAGDAEAIRGALQKARAALGPITVLQWTAYSAGAGDFTQASLEEIRAQFDVPIVGLMAAVQTALPDLREQRGAILVTNGGFGFSNPQVDAFGAQHNLMGLSVGNAAKHKLVGLLAHKLKPEGVYVGEVVILSTVKGTAWDDGHAALEPQLVADAFWKLYSERDAYTVNVG